MRPESVGLSSARLELIDRFVQRKYIDRGLLPCALTLVARRGEIAHFNAIGMADVERKTPVREDTIFRIYSMTKPITSIAFMMLVEQGLVALDDPVHRVIPAWKELGVFQGGFMQTFRTKRCERPMLMIDLLRHTSGLTYGFQESTNVDAAYRKLKIGEIEKSGTLDGMIETIGEAAAGVLAGNGVELFGVDGHRGLHRRENFGAEVRGFLAHENLQTARHGRHRFPCASRQGGAVRGVLHAHGQRRDGVAGRSDEEPLSAATGFGFRRRRVGFDGERLSANFAGC